MIFLGDESKQPISKKSEIGRPFLVGMLSCFIASGSFCQTSQIIKGVIYDSTTNSVLVFATVTVFKSSDTSIVSYRLTNPDGEFKVPNLPLNTPLYALITHTGHKIIRLEFTLTSTVPKIDFGNIYLHPDFTPLENVLIISERPPVIVKNDTIEFNASSFKTLPNALVEDLLKKLPGVVVSREGSITVNGKIVNRILVDSKEFFGSDIRIATKNLPADIIDKVQVIDDQQELDDNPLADRSTVGKEINLKLKKGIKKGWFGKTYAGAGSQKRYESGGIINFFRDTLQLSLIGFSNNINKPSFGLDDIKNIGGFARSGYSSSMMSSTGGIVLDGISFGATSEGIQTSSGGGFNLNNELSKGQSLNLRYFYGNLSSDYGRINETSSWYQDTLLTTTDSSRQFTKDYSHRIGGTWKWQISPYTNFTIKPALTFETRTSTLQSGSLSNQNFQGVLNKGSSYNSKREEYRTMNIGINFRQNFKKAGRIFTANAFVNASSNQEHLVINSQNLLNASSTNLVIDEQRISSLPDSRIGVTVSYVEPISKKIIVQLSHDTRLSKYASGIKTFDKDQSSGKYTLADSLLSNDLKRNYFSNISTAGITWTIKRLRISPKLSLESLYVDNNFQSPKLSDQGYYYLLPSFFLTWNGFYISYFTTVIESRISELQPIKDNSNPLYIRSGNPYLTPSYLHSIYATYDKYDAKKLVTYRCMLSSILYEKGVIYQRMIDSNGIQNILPANVHGIYNYRSNLNLTKQFKKTDQWDFSLDVNFYSDLTRTKMFFNSKYSSLTNYTFRPSINYSLNFKDQLEINQQYTLNVNTAKYSDPIFENTQLITHQVSSEIILRKIKPLVIESSLDYYHNTSISKPFDKNIFSWNAAIHLLFMKNQRADFRISAYDILNENRSIQRNIFENTTSIDQLKTLHRYILFSFIYNIRDVKTKKVGSKDKLLLF